MEIIRKPFEMYSCNDDGCGCDVNTPSGDCKHVDDGGCGCDD